MDTFDIAKQAAASDAFCCESLFILISNWVFVQFSTQNASLAAGDSSQLSNVGGISHLK